MSVQNATARQPMLRPVRAQAVITPAPAPVSPGDLEGLSGSAYGSMARSFREKGKNDLADRYTLEAVKAAKDGTEALGYATQRYGPKADASNSMYEYVRSDAPFVASPEVQAKAVELAAAKFTNYSDAEWALRNHPAQTPEANTIMIKRIADLAKDSDQVMELRPLFKLLGTPEGIAYARAAEKSKPQTSFWTRLWRGLQHL